ncbi:MAG: LysR family transcriptional regulator [Oscillospiraceae bacterium]|nr:LysR family transcriptional regulator [Oscillospiraceae bacterium]
MEVRYLQEFVTLERMRNFTRAADALYTTEATLSRHIRTLEKELGQPLFIRTTRRMELTEFGKKFLVYAEKITQTMRECEINLLKQDPRHVDSLLIGVFGKGFHYPVVDKSLRRFTLRVPNCAIGMVEGDPVQLKEKLHKRECNVIIIREKTEETDDAFKRLTLLRDPLCVIVSKDDPLAQEETVEVSRLRERKTTMLTEYMLSYEVFVELCRAHGFEPHIRVMFKERNIIENFIVISEETTVLCRDMAERLFDPAAQVVREIAPRTCECVNLLALKNTSLPEITRIAFECFAETVAVT